MTPELRQRHRFIWRLWALLLPIGFVGAIIVLPQKVTQSTLPDKSRSPLNKVEKTQQSDWLTANIRSSNDTIKQLEIILKRPLDIPAAQLFWQNTFVGNLGAKGTYRFPLDPEQTANAPFLLEIRDPINQTVFQKITFDE